MTKLLEDAIAKLRDLPDDRQDDVAALVMSLVDHDPQSLGLTDQQVAEVERRLGSSSDYVSHEDVVAFFKTRTG